MSRGQGSVTRPDNSKYTGAGSPETVAIPLVPTRGVGTRVRHGGWERAGLAYFSERHDADAVAVGEGHGLGLVDDDGLAGLDGQHPAAGLVDRFDSGAADGRNVKAHILLWLG